MFGGGYSVVSFGGLSSFNGHCECYWSDDSVGPASKVPKWVNGWLTTMAFNRFTGQVALVRRQRPGDLLQCLVDWLFSVQLHGSAYILVVVFVEVVPHSRMCSAYFSTLGYNVASSAAAGDLVRRVSRPERDVDTVNNQYSGSNPQRWIAEPVGWVSAGSSTSWKPRGRSLSRKDKHLFFSFTLFSLFSFRILGFLKLFWFLAFFWWAIVCLLFSLFWCFYSP